MAKKSASTKPSIDPQPGIDVTAALAQLDGLMPLVSLAQNLAPIADDLLDIVDDNPKLADMTLVDAVDLCNNPLIRQLLPNSRPLATPSDHITLPTEIELRGFIQEHTTANDAGPSTADIVAHFELADDANTKKRLRRFLKGFCARSNGKRYAQWTVSP